MLDTLRTTTAGMCGSWVCATNMLPELISMGVAIATLVYLIIKIKKELGK
tara:strand:+ start:57 stop:206 length:150 start_codon:yes stop_codon:yes gene_type:complete